jgi:hypothetical protein
MGGRGFTMKYKGNGFPYVRTVVVFHTYDFLNFVINVDYKMA